MTHQYGVMFGVQILVQQWKEGFLAHKMTYSFVCVVKRCVSKKNLNELTL